MHLAESAGIHPPLTSIATKQFRDNFGTAFHVGLRKGVDSQESVIAWNAIHLLPDALYSAFCDYVVVSLAQVQRLSVPTFRSILRNWPGVYLTQLPDEVANKLNRPLIHIFEAAMRILPDNDIAKLFEWFEFEVGHPT